MKNIIVLIFVAVFFMQGCAGRNGVAEITDKTVQIVVLHTNDHHGSIMGIVSVKNGVSSEYSLAGSVASRAAFIKDVRKTYKNVILLDAGDLTYTTQPLSMFFNGDLDVELYDRMGYDAVAIGNNEFQKGTEIFQRQIKKASFAFLGANVKYTDGSYVAKPWIIKDFNGLRVGIFGLLTTSTGEVSPEDGIIINNEAETGKEAVKYLREKEKCDIIIALTHLGVPEGKNIYSSADLARDVQGIDLIIDGHSHTYMTEPLTENGVPIVQAGEYGNNIGMAIIGLSDKKKISFAWEQVVTKNIPPDKETADIISLRAAEADSGYGVRIGEATDDFLYGKEINEGESAVANVVTDALAWYTSKKADFALINSGTIRGGISKGQITLRDTLTLLPFSNNITIVTLKGKDFLKFFENLIAKPKGKRSFPQVSSSVKYEVDYSGGIGVLKNISVNGEAIEPNKTYRFATIDFVTNGRGHTLKKDGTIINTGTDLRKAIEEYFRYKIKISPVLDGRIKTK